MTNMLLFSIYISNSLFIIFISLAMFAKKQCSYVVIEEVDFYGSFYIAFVPEREILVGGLTVLNFISFCQNNLQKKMK